MMMKKLYQDAGGIFEENPKQIIESLSICREIDEQIKI